MHWIEVSVVCSLPSEEPVSAALMNHGCAGTATEWFSEAGTPYATVRGWLTPPCDDLLTRLKGDLEELRLQDAIAYTEIHCDEVSDEGWLDSWRSHHHPRAVGRSLLITPPWRSGNPGNRFEVVIEPGMAFGTGSHPTTLLSLELMERVIVPGYHVADVGTGSAILAIAAARLGASHVTASEIDALPRQIAQQNVDANSVGHIVEVLDPEEFAARRPQCDVVVCNIIAETIAELAPLLATIVKPTGHLILSGIVAERLDLPLRRLTAEGLRPLEIVADDVWRAVLLTRP